MKTDIAIAQTTIEITNSGQIQLTPSGVFRATDGRPADIDGWFVDEEVATSVIEKFASRKNPLVVDYNHASLVEGHEAPAAGWMSEIFWHDGLNAKVDWTDKAKLAIANKEQRYISPVFTYNKKTGHVIEIINAALTNNPALDGMAEAALTKQLQQHSGEKPMPEPNDEKAELSIIFDLAATKSELLSALKLNVGATGEQLKTAFDATLNKIEAAESAAMAAKQRVAELSKILDDPDDLMAAIEQLKRKTANATVPKELLAKREEVIEQLKAEKQTAIEENIQLQRAAIIKQAQSEYRLPDDIDSVEMQYALARPTIADLKDYLSTCKPNRPPVDNQTGGIAPATANSALNRKANPKSVIAAEETAKLARELGVSLEDAAIELASRKEAM